MADNQTPDFEALGREILEDAITYAAVTGLNFFKESFEKQGWTGNSFTAWDPVAGKGGQGILINTAFLRDSIQILDRKPNRIEYAATAPYAGIHNNGGIITVRVTAKSRKFFWYMFKATGKVMWKYMALTKKETMSIKIPQRQFIGESQILMNSLDEWIIKQITERFNQAI